MNYLYKNQFNLNPSKNNIFCLIIFLEFIISRVFLFLSGVRPNIEHLISQWQYLDLNDLSKDYLSSLFYLHSQPPLWNAIVGFIWKISARNEQKFVIFYYLFSIFLSFLMVYFIYEITSKLTQKYWLGFSASSIYILFTSSYFYENYIFYPLFLSFLILSFLFFYYVSLKSDKLLNSLILLLFALISLLCLSLSWSLFHPFFIISISIFSILKCKQKYRKMGLSSFSYTRIIYLLISIVVILNLVLPIKNTLVFGNFGTSSWFGLNLSQVAPLEDWKECYFSPVSKSEINRYSISAKNKLSRINHPVVSNFKKSYGNGINFNHYAYILKSKYCTKIAFNAIRKKPFIYIKARLKSLISSHSALSDNYFSYPINLEPDSEMTRKINFRNSIYIPFNISSKINENLKFYTSDSSRTYIAPLLLPLFTLLSIYLILQKNSIFPKDKLSTKFFMIAIFFILWVTIISHAFNGAEQHRMRFTIEPLYLISFSIFVSNLLNFFRNFFQ